MRSTFTKILVNYTSEESFLTTVNNKIIFFPFFFFAKDFLPLLLRLTAKILANLRPTILIFPFLSLQKYLWLIFLGGGGGLKTLLFSPTSLLTFVKLISLLCLIYSGNDF